MFRNLDVRGNKFVNRLFFAFGAMCGASLGWALPDGNLLVTTFLAVAAGLFTLGIWLSFQFLRKLWVKQ